MHGRAARTAVPQHRRFRCACGSSRRTRRDRSGQVLFIDARGLGYLVDRAERALTDEEIVRIGDTYHAWRRIGVGRQRR